MESEIVVTTNEITLRCEGSFTLDFLEDWLRENDLNHVVSVDVDFRAASWFDIAALIFLLSILSNLRSKGSNVNISLPDISHNRKARDFLCRWNFKEALRDSLDSELSNVLPADQLSYFDAPQQIYTPRQIMDEYGDLADLSSLQLLQITSLTGLQGDGNYRVSFPTIGEVTNRASSKALYSALKTSLGASNDWATKFGRVLIHQALLNAFEHPEANVAFIAMARQKTNLVIGITDNGLTIPTTIAEAYDHYDAAKCTAKKELSSYQLDANRIAYATLQGTSRKPPTEGDPDRGMGLYYIKTLAAEVGGSLIIRSSEASVMFRTTPDTGRIHPEPRSVARLDRGNLLKIFLPIVVK